MLESYFFDKWWTNYMLNLLAFSFGVFFYFYVNYPKPPEHDEDESYGYIVGSLIFSFLEFLDIFSDWSYLVMFIHYNRIINIMLYFTWLMPFLVALIINVN